MQQDKVAYKEFRNVDIRILRLAIDCLRRAELDYLDSRMPSSVRESARAYLFGVKNSPLPQVCNVLGINVSAARLLLIQWRAQGRIGDPIFSYLLDPKNMVNWEKGIPLSPPNFGSVYAGSCTRKQEGSGQGS